MVGSYPAGVTEEDFTDRSDTQDEPAAEPKQCGWFSVSGVTCTLPEGHEGRHFHDCMFAGCMPPLPPDDFPF